MGASSIRGGARVASLQQGTQGQAVKAMQQQLINLGFLYEWADGDFGPVTALAVRDFQRRSLLLPDAIVGPRTAAALNQAIARKPPSPSSPYRRLREQAAASGASDAHLPGLDRGFDHSPFRQHLENYAGSMASAPDGSTVVQYPRPASGFPPFPAVGVMPTIISGSQGRGGLDFLSEEVAQACVCVGSFTSGAPLAARWYGRRAANENVQFWSATKFVAGLHVLCQVNRRHPSIPISQCQVGGLRGGAARREPFDTLFTEMVSYGKDTIEPGHSNAVAAMLKQIRDPSQPDVQQWLRALSANINLVLLGGYGTDPYMSQARLVGPSGTELVPHAGPGTSRNLVSAHDLVRMLSMLGWHMHLAPASRLPAAQWSSLRTLIHGLGQDTARYVDIALETLGLLPSVRSPAIISKLGYGTTAPGFPDAPALTYAAFAQFIDTRTTPLRQRSFCLALRIPTKPGAGARHDARMAAEVTEIVRRVFNEEFA
jgi:peptidoglycan hydrolase-like protein with peptidoglycan-binding domain